MSVIEDLQEIARAVASAIVLVDGYAGKLHGCAAHLDQALNGVNQAIKELGGTPADHPTPGGL